MTSFPVGMRNCWELLSDKFWSYSSSRGIVSRKCWFVCVMRQWRWSHFDLIFPSEALECSKHVKSICGCILIMFFFKNVVQFLRSFFAQVAYFVTAKLALSTNASRFHRFVYFKLVFWYYTLKINYHIFGNVNELFVVKVSKSTNPNSKVVTTLILLWNYSSVVWIFVTLNKKPTNWWGQGKCYTSQLENRHTHSVFYRWHCCVKPLPNYSTLCQLDLFYELLCSIRLHFAAYWK